MRIDRICGKSRAALTLFWKITTFLPIDPGQQAGETTITCVAKTPITRQIRHSSRVIGISCKWTMTFDPNNLRTTPKAWAFRPLVWMRLQRC